MIKSVYIYVLLALVAAAAGAKLYVEGKRYGINEVTLLWQEEKAMLLRKANEVLMKAKEEQDLLNHKLMLNRLEKQREIDNITRRYNDAIDSLQHRPTERATSDSGLPEGAPTGVGCTGAGLARPDASFLTGYAAEAAKLQSALNSCKSQYDAVTQTNRQEQK
jgi:hypothetical protein